MTLLVVTLVSLTVLLAVLLYKSEAHALMKLAILPLALLSTFFGIEHYKDQLGRPLYERPIGNFTYVTHVVIGNTIELIAADTTSSRLYIFEASDEEEDALNGAQEKAQQGIQQEGNFKSLQSDNEGDGELEFWTKEDLRKE